MIKFVTGNLLESDAECLVNTVNCEGYMGKGLAYQFKLKFPETNKDYIKACNSGQLTIGKLHYFKEDEKVILNFPTKNKWRAKSKIEYIKEGLDEFISIISTLNVKSFAIPPLGCGNGGLSWNEIKEVLLSKLKCVEQQYDFFIYEPSKNFRAISKEVPKLSLSGLVLMQIKLNLNKFNHIRLQKTAYFMDVFSNENYFNFKKYKYGPYDNSISIISKNIKEFQNYYNVNTKEAYDIAYNNCVSNNMKNKLSCKELYIKKACNFVNRIKNDKDLECISTITFLIRECNFKSEIDIIENFKKWSKDKDERFSIEDIKKGIDFLVDSKIIMNTLVGYELTN